MQIPCYGGQMRGWIPIPERKEIRYSIAEYMEEYFR